MANQVELLLEAERRGILPPEKQPLLEEARKRSLVPTQAPVAAESPQPEQPQQDSSILPLAREAVQGFTFEFADEIGTNLAAGAAKSAQSLGVIPDTGESFSDIRESMRQNYLQEREQFADQNKVKATAANIAGSLAAGGPVAKTLMGILRGVGRALPAAAAPAVAPAAAGVAAAIEGGLFGAGAAEEGDRVEGAAQGALLSAALGVAADRLLSGLTGSAAEKKIAELTPSIDDLTALSSEMYKKADDLGVVLTQDAVSSIKNRLLAKAKAAGFNTRIHPKVSAAIDSFDDVAVDTPSLSRLEQQRRILGSAAGSMEADERRLGRMLIDEYDDFITNLDDAAVAAGDAGEAGNLLNQARALWQRRAKLDLIDESIEKARNQASGFENGMRIQFRQILNNKKKLRGFTDDEVAQMKKIVHGGTAENIAKFVGRFGFGEGPSTSALGAAAGAFGGAALFGPAGAAAVPILGQTSRNLAQRMTRKSVDELKKRVSGGGVSPSQIVKDYMNVTRANADPAELANILVTSSGDDILKAVSQLDKLKGRERNLAAAAIAALSSVPKTTEQDTEE